MLLDSSTANRIWKKSAHLIRGERKLFFGRKCRFGPEKKRGTIQNSEKSHTQLAGASLAILKNGKTLAWELLSR